MSITRIQKKLDMDWLFEKVNEMALDDADQTIIEAYLIFAYLIGKQGRGEVDKK